MLTSLALAASLVHGQPHEHGLSCSHPEQAPRVMAIDFENWPNHRDVAANPQETALKGVRQLTFGGQNAEAYWSLDGKRIVWQSMQPGYPDEQIFVMNADGSGKRRVSTGKGRTTCSYFTPDGKWIYFSSTHAKNEGAQAPVDMSQGYVWRVNPQFSLYRSRPDGSQLTTILSREGYIAETTIDPAGKYMTFTASFDGDLDIYRSDLEGKGIKRLTNELGYDGGPFVSWDGKQIVYRRAPAFADDAQKQEYLRLLKQDLVRPSRMNVWIMNADGTRKRQVTNLPGASFAPFLHPDGKTIIFSSNHHDPRGREFDLFAIQTDGTGLRQITHTPDFDGFPMFTRDGKRLVWASNRYGAVPRETNVFVADWTG